MDGNYTGILQDIKAQRDSTDFLCFAECFDCKESFTVIFAYGNSVDLRKQLGIDTIYNKFGRGCDNLFEGFECFAFVCPMRDPESQKDIHAMNIDFPTNVRVYKRLVKDTWAHIVTKRVMSFKDYTRLQFNTIYGLRDSLSE